MIDAETINCWKLNYGLDNRTPADAVQWWHDNDNGRAPAGAVAALGLCLDEIEALKATISCLEKDNADALELLSSDVKEKHRLNMEYANAVLDLRTTISRLREHVGHKPDCCSSHLPNCDCGYDAMREEIGELRAELPEARKPTCNACANFHSCWSRSWNNPSWARVFCPDGERFERVDPVRLYEIDAAMAGGEK